ncbi:MAG TPA: hypothetical protein VLI54_04895 [Bacillota bacterium]|nr:hypothetical protein [Bacillota bacterium]
MIYVERPDAPEERVALHSDPLDPDVQQARRAACAVGLHELRDRLSNHRLSGLPWFLQLPPADKPPLTSYPLALTGRAPLPPAVVQPVDVAMSGKRTFSSGLTEQTRFALLGEPLLEDAPSGNFPLGYTALYYACAAPDRIGVAGLMYTYDANGLVEMTAQLRPLPEGAVRDDFAGVWEGLGLTALAPLPDPSRGLVITAEQVDGTQLQALSDYLVRMS